MNPSVLLAFAGGSLAAMYAAITLFRRQYSVARWAFIVAMLVLAVESLFSGLSLAASEESYAGPSQLATGIADVVQWQSWRIVAMAFLIAPWCVFSLYYARGVTQKRPWKTIALGAVSFAPALLALILRDDLIVAIRPTAFAFQTVIKLGWPAQVVNLAFLLGSITVLSNLERTYRAAVGAVRWRIKFMLLGLGLLFAVRIYTSSQALMVQSVDPQFDVFNAVALVAGTLLMLRSLFRSGHFEMDVYPSPAVLRSSVTIVLAGFYLVLVGLIFKIAASFGIVNTLAINAFVGLICVAGLAITLQSDRVKLNLHRFVSRHFQRPFYDYRSVWRAFTESTATQLDQRGLSRTLLSQIADLFRANSVSIWLIREDGKNLSCAASSALPEASWGQATPSPESSLEILVQFRKTTDPVNFESETAPWADALRQCHPKLFKDGGDRVAMALNRGGELLGILVVGDRVGGAVFATQDFDMLRCVADHAASSLLNIRLSGRLVQSRELEAFQAMAAFFVHDLKNAASTLNLMLPNLPLHWDNPEFREDALRGITKTVGHINTLIGRLTELRHELKLRPVTADLNGVVKRALENWKNASDVTLVKNFSELPSLSIDPDQIFSVVTNLLLNARDATLEAGAGPGEVRIETFVDGSMAVITVMDKGCGMSQNFLNNSLFKPFQTTKKNGIGIGMFQSKMIVEAHGGRLGVESTQGKGTTFRVFLPLGAGTAKPSLKNADSLFVTSPQQ